MSISNISFFFHEFTTERLWNFFSKRQDILLRGYVEVDDVWSMKGWLVWKSGICFNQNFSFSFCWAIRSKDVKILSGVVTHFEKINNWSLRCLWEIKHRRSKGNIYLHEIVGCLAVYPNILFIFHEFTTRRLWKFFSKIMIQSKSTTSLFESTNNDRDMKERGQTLIFIRMVSIYIYDRISLCHNRFYNNEAMWKFSSKVCGLVAKRLGEPRYTMGNEHGCHYEIYILFIIKNFLLRHEFTTRRLWKFFTWYESWSIGRERLGSAWKQCCVVCTWKQRCKRMKHKALTC